jgi:hypothetical protein
MYLALSAFTSSSIFVLTVYEIRWKKNIIESDRPQMAVRLVSIANWILKATNTHSEYVIFIYFLMQQWLHESTILLGYTYISFLVSITLRFHIHNVRRLRI